jgi:Na+/proline symporter/TM2 domain-containing membrane protein YozV
VAVVKIGGMQALKLQLQVVGDAVHKTGAPTSNPLNFFPDFHLGWTDSPIWTLPLLTFITYLGVQWWSAWYPGAEPGGGGYVAQRMFCARDEKNSLGATLWFNIAHYAVRPWPWIITGLVALAVYSPHGGLHPDAGFGANPQQGYVMVLRDFLPPALRGVMVAAFLAAFMSTLGTQLNWGVSYLVNDLYRRFLVREKTEKHYVGIGRLFTILLVLVSGYVAQQLHSVGQGWQIVLGLGVGTGAVYILRWYWWRINAWSEISAMATSLVVSLLLNWKGLWLNLTGKEALFTGSGPVVFAKTALTTTIITTIAWIAVTFLTKPEPERILVSFYRKTRPDVRGWQPIARLTPEVTPNRDLGRNLLAWLLGCAMVYLALFGLGKLILNQPGFGIVLLIASIVCATLLYFEQSSRGWGAEQDAPVTASQHAAKV